MAKGKGFLRLDYYDPRRVALPRALLKEIKVRKLGRASGYTAWIVDGSVIRGVVDIDFAIGGNPARYSYVPEGEIWLEWTGDEDDVKATFMHEVIEADAMRRGCSYDEGHEWASAGEAQIRALGENVPLHFVPNPGAHFWIIEWDASGQRVGNDMQDTLDNAIRSAEYALRRAERVVRATIHEGTLDEYDPTPIAERALAKPVAVEPTSAEALVSTNYWIDPHGEIYPVAYYGHEAAKVTFSKFKIVPRDSDLVLMGWLQVSQEPGQEATFYYGGEPSARQLDAVFDLAVAHRAQCRDGYCLRDSVQFAEDAMKWLAEPTVTRNPAEPRIRTLCVVCKGVIHDGPPDTRGGVSHGICKSCLPAWAESVGLTPEDVLEILAEKAAAEKNPARPTPAGHCYDWAWQQIAFNPAYANAVLVHGTVAEPFARPPRRYKHAWLELDGVVRDWQTMEAACGGKWRGVGYPVEVFDELYQPKRAARYTQDQALKNAVRAGHYGPWTKREPRSRRVTKKNPSAEFPQTIDADEVTAILAAQPGNAGKSAESLRDRWVASETFHLMTIPAGLNSLGVTPGKTGETRSAGLPIIVDANVNMVGRSFGGVGGAAPDFLVLDGQNRVVAARRLGPRALILAYVGDAALHRMQQQVQEAVAIFAEVDEVVAGYLDGRGFIDILRGFVKRGLMMQEELDALRQARRDAKKNPAEASPLKKQLLALRPQLAAAAQVVYAEWAQDEEGFDEWLGAGGICQDIADAFAGVLGAAGIDATVMDNNGVGEQHVWAVAYDGNSSYVVDIPPGVYEAGGGYNWRKREGVEFDPDDIVIDDVTGDFDPEMMENPSTLPDLPAVQHREVFHVGAEPSGVHPKRSAMSYEGPGLSVSVHPEAWRKIARLGDAPVWRLRRADGTKGQFVNMKKLLRDEARVVALLDEARARGLVEGAGAYRLTYRDGETGQRAYIDFATEAAALENREEFGGTVKPVAAFRALPTLQRWWREFFTKDVPDSFAREAAIIAVLHGSGLDGLWWPDRFNVLHLSAPRGVIFPAALSLWTLS